MSGNILITSAGQRVVLTQLFQEAAKVLSRESKVFTTDMCPEMSPACQVSDRAFKVRRCTDTGYIEELLSLCQKNSVSIVVPTIDTELAVLARNKNVFLDAGISIIVSDIDFIELCRDKRKTISFLESRGISMPKILDKYAPVFPMFAKPYDGSLSSNLHIIRSQEDLTSDVLNDPKLIFMEYIDKNEFKEYTVDMYYGKDHRVKSIVPRERIKIRAGEINKGRTRKNYLVDYLKERLDIIPGAIGCLCMQFFYRESDNQVYGIEINPRFGGGYPLTYFAHADFPSNIIQEYSLGESVDYSEDWLDNTLMLRYDKDIIVYG